MERKIGEWLDAYLRGSKSLDELQAWLAEITVGPGNAPTAAVQVEFVIGEALAGNLDRSALRAELADIRSSLLVGA